VDEIASSKGHKYVTLGVDLETSRVIPVCEGKGKSTLKSIGQHLEGKGVQKSQVTQLSMDLSPAFIAAAAESFPSAKITFDRFHVVKLFNEAMDYDRCFFVDVKDRLSLTGCRVLASACNLRAAQIFCKSLINSRVCSTFPAR